MDIATKLVLVVDDDQEDNFFLQEALTAIDPTVRSQFFTRGEDLLAYLQTDQQPPFVILSEVVLSGMSGLELRQKIDADMTLRKRVIPFIFMSSPVLDEQVGQAYQLADTGLF